MNKIKELPLFTMEDVSSCWEHADSYLLQILNGEYEIEDARNDLISLIGSKYDPRETDFKEE